MKRNMTFILHLFTICFILFTILSCASSSSYLTKKVRTDLSQYNKKNIKAFVNVEKDNFFTKGMMEAAGYIFHVVSSAPYDIEIKPILKSYDTQSVDTKYGFVKNYACSCSGTFKLNALLLVEVFDSNKTKIYSYKKDASTTSRSYAQANLAKGWRYNRKILKGCRKEAKRRATKYAAGSLNANVQNDHIPTIINELNNKF